MQFALQPWELAFAILASWINREQQESNDYLRTENQVLREYIGKKRILLNDNQRRRLAVKGRVLGRKRLEEVGTLFTPDTILRWHRKLVARNGISVTVATAQLADRECGKSLSTWS